MSAEIKCPHCGEWTSWNKNLTDACHHCNLLIDQRRATEIEEFHERERQHNKKDIFKIRETDGPFMIAGKRILFLFHIVFGAIAWFFIWLFASTPG